jgi:hypothetical protein
MTAIEFLKSKNAPCEGLNESQARMVARAYGWAAPKASATVEYYVPKESKKGPGMFLKIELEGARAFFGRLCDGDKLTEEARAAIAAIGNDCADLL